jgi:exodeoxyribonuclease VII small subunit
MSNQQKMAKKAQTGAAKKLDELDFEAAMLELETLVSGMESGDLPLEESLKQFEKGIQLSRRCQDALNNAEQRVKILLDDQEHDFQIASE